MTIFHHEVLDKLKNPSLALAVAQEIHTLAEEYVEQGKLPQYFFDREIYEWGQLKTLPNGKSYHEISQYSEGFGASLFIQDDEMLLLGSNHELSPLEAIDGDRDLYLAPLLNGLPPRWDFVVDMLQTEQRFEVNAPASVFWFKNGNWHITNDYASILASEYGTRLGDYKGAVDYVPRVDFAAIFAHGDRTEVDRSLIVNSYLREWMTEVE